MRFRIIAFAAVVAALVPALALARPTTTKFVVALAGKYETPKGAPAGKGTATITISGTKVCWAFTGLSGISKETAAHIHKAPAGKAGPIVVPFGGAFKAKGCIATTAALAKAIVAAALEKGSVPSARERGATSRGTSPSRAVRRRTSARGASWA